MAAAYVLGINMFVAGIFAVAFAVVATTMPTSRGPFWLALGYATGVVYAGLQFAIPLQSDPLPVGVASYLIYLLAMILCLIGVTRHYGARPQWVAIAAIGGLATLGSPFIVSLPPSSVLGATLYQAPYFAMQALFVVVIARSGRRQPLDVLLMILQGLAALIYIARPLIAVLVGVSDDPQDYLSTVYGMISQSIGAISLIALALILLLVMVRDAAAEMTTRSETDPLSGTLNRRGFDSHASEALAVADRPATLIVADLDHFKRVNDTRGHEAGDTVIAAFARVLRASAPADAIVGRLGGEEFAMLIPGASLREGQRHAEAARAAFAILSPSILDGDEHLSASFGVAQLADGETLRELSRRADTALYQAKASGRNRVCTAISELSEARAVLLPAKAGRQAA